MPYVEKLKMIKSEKGLHNADIAKLGDLPLATVTRVFNGQTSNPTFETITRIAIAMGVSLDELAGLKRPDEPPIPSPIETALNTYAELLKEKDDRIQALEAEKDKEQKEKYKLAGIIIKLLIFMLVWLTLDILNGHFKFFT